MLSSQNQDRLRQYVAKMLGVITTPAVYGRISLERRRVFDRYQTVFFALWLLAAPDERIKAAWQGKAVRFNLLLKDFRAICILRLELNY
jgi:hypothetical protein